MKKVIPGLICLLLISSCGFEIPQSITIKGKPSLYVPLGSPFAGEKYKGKKLEDLIDPEYIKTMIKASKEVKEVYEIDPAMAGISTDALTYLVEYQLADKKLNLQEQMDEAMAAINNEGVRIPNVSGVPVSSSDPYYIDGDGGLSKSEPSNPFLTIPLNDMVKFVQEVTRKPGQSFGLKILKKDSNISLLKENLRLRIPALGITYNTPGTLDSDGNLQFVDTTTTSSTFYPRSSLQDGLLIYAKITGNCGEGIIKPEIVFEWEEAIIDTLGDSAIHEKFSNENKSLENFLGGAASFRQVLGYVYIYGMDSLDVIYMTVRFNDVTSTRNLQFIQGPPPTFAGGNLPPSSFVGTDEPLPMTDFFNNKEDKKLEVDINIPKLHITRDEHLDKTIQCKLCVLIPLDLIVSEVDGGAPDININGVNIKSAYVPLKLDDNFNFGDGDLFGRNEDDIIEITSVEILLKIEKDDITVIDRNKLAVLIKSNRDYRLLKFDEPSASITFTGTSLEKPFNPGFTVLLKKDTPGGDSGSFKIKKEKGKTPKFDFKLYVTAETRLEYTMDL